MNLDEREEQEWRELRERQVSIWETMTTGERICGVVLIVVAIVLPPCAALLSMALR